MLAVTLTDFPLSTCFSSFLHCIDFSVTLSSLAVRAVIVAAGSYFLFRIEKL